MPKIGLQSLKQTLQSNVCEIRFSKRRPGISDGSPIRTMLCTLDMTILNSLNGRTTLNFKPPTQAPKYNPETKNLLLVWDILMQDWRMVNMDDCYVNFTIARDEWWKYFNENIYVLTTEQKQAYMGK